MDSPLPNHFKLLSIWVRGHLKHSGRLIKSGLPEVITFFPSSVQTRGVFDETGLICSDKWGRRDRAEPFFSVTLLFGVPYFTSPQRQVDCKTPPSLAPMSTRSTLKHIFLLYSSLAFPPKYFGFPATSLDYCVVFARPFLTGKHMAWEKKRMLKKSYDAQLEMWTRIILKAKVSAVMNLWTT